MANELDITFFDVENEVKEEDLLPNVARVGIIPGSTPISSNIHDFAPGSSDVAGTPKPPKYVSLCGSIETWEAIAVELADDDDQAHTF